MVSVLLGAKARDYDFNVSDVDLSTLNGTSPRYTLTGDGITIAESKSDYVMLEGKFKLVDLIRGDFESGVRQLDSIVVVENGKVSYKAANLDMNGEELESGATFKAFLAGEAYAIKGNAFDNEITGATQKDVIHGMDGNDMLDGRDGNDRLFGEAGSDRLTGGLGNDQLSGGKGADTLVFLPGDGDDIITDFRAAGRGQDVIDLSAHDAVASFEDLVISEAGSSVRVEIGDDSILLRNVSIADVDAADFLF